MLSVHRRLPIVLFHAAALLLASQSPLVLSQAVTPTSIKIGQTLGLTGARQVESNEVLLGARAYLDRINRDGGVHGRKIDLVTLDDGSDTKRAETNARELQRQGILAYFLTRGTPPTEAVAKISQAHKIPLIAPSTGAMSLHKPPQRYVFNVRSTYQSESRAIVKHGAFVGQKQFAIILVDDSFGADVKAGLDEMARELSLPEVAAYPFDAKGNDPKGAAAKFLATKPHAPAVVIAAATKAAVPAIKALREGGYTGQIYCLSNLSNETFNQALGNAAHGTAITQVLPRVNGVSPLAKQFRADMRGIKDGRPSYGTFEGYIAAKVLVEALQRAGKTLDTESLVTALESMRDYPISDVDNIHLNFSATNRTGTAYVDLTVLDRNGKVLY